ncbi:MAG: hypothetical protein QM323_11600 [Acidobacteriota bacterium]|nr:hypothetical protein [Acidobacteriota bacterium]
MNHVLLVLALAGPLVMVAAVLAIALARVAARPAPSPQGPVGDHDESEDAPAHLPGAAPDRPAPEQPAAPAAPPPLHGSRSRRRRASASRRAP